MRESQYNAPAGIRPEHVFLLGRLDDDTGERWRRIAAHGSDGQLYYWPAEDAEQWSRLSGREYLFVDLRTALRRLSHQLLPPAYRGIAARLRWYLRRGWEMEKSTSQTYARQHTLTVQYWRSERDGVRIVLRVEGHGENADY